MSYRPVDDILDNLGLAALEAYRERLHDAVRGDAYKGDCGTIELQLPGVSASLYDRSDGVNDLNRVQLHVRMYRFGIGRSHVYTGADLSKAVALADAQLAAWLVEEALRADGSYSAHPNRCKECLAWPKCRCKP